MIMFITRRCTALSISTAFYNMSVGLIVSLFCRVYRKFIRQIKDSSECFIEIQKYLANILLAVALLLSLTHTSLLAQDSNTIAQPKTIGQLSGSVLPFTISESFYDRPLDPSASYFEIFDDADIIMSAQIESVEGKVTDDIYSELYALLRVSGQIATPNGLIEVPQNYFIRAPFSWAEESSIGANFIFFIKNNLLTFNPIRRAYPVKNNIIHHNIFTDKPLLMIDSIGEIRTTPNFNTCDISEYHKFYNANEPLENIVKFTCANGTQWIRGNDKPIDYVERNMTSTALLASASLYMRSHNISAPVVTVGRAEEANQPLRRESKLTDLNRFRDEIFRQYIESFDSETWKRMRKIPPEQDTRIIDYVQREYARGKKSEDIPDNIKEFEEIVNVSRGFRINIAEEFNAKGALRRTK